jgi:hypothetical protein
MARGMLATVMALVMAPLATAAFGQAQPGGAPAAAGTLAAAGTPGAADGHAAAPIPNLSGMWAHPYLTGFEPPVSGPGPVRNKSRLPNGVANFQKLVGDYTNPILKPEAAEVVKQHGEITLAGSGYPTPSNQCWPGGVPYVFWDFIVQIIQQPDRITIIYRHGDEIRRVRLNDSHPAQVTPTWYGDSIGHYEGDTLVIDTVGIKIGPYAMVDMYGTPHSPALHVVERYRLVDYAEAKDAIDRNDKENLRATGGAEIDYNDRGKVLSLEFTVDDDGVFAMPWKATITYRRNQGEWTELICAENPREFDRAETPIPRADKPDF